MKPIITDLIKSPHLFYNEENQKEGKFTAMRIYLDNCCYNRHYDDQTQFKVTMETRAKLHVQEEICNGKYELVCSYMLDYENSKNTDETKRKVIHDYQKQYHSYYVPIERRESLQDKINEIMSYGIHYKDATHVACAIYAGCEYLLTTDIKFMKHYKGTEIQIVNPVTFIQLVEGEE